MHDAKRNALRSAGAVVTNRKDKVLVVKDDNFWSLPRGYIGIGEVSLGAVIREIHEKAGIRHLNHLGVFGSYLRYRLTKDKQEIDRSEPENVSMHRFETEQEELKLLDPDNPKARWVLPERVVYVLTHPNEKEYFRGVLPVLFDH